MVIWFDPFSDDEDRAEAAIEAHAQALAAIDAHRVAERVAEVVARLAPMLRADAAMVTPAATREILLLAADRRSVALCLARLGASDPILAAMFDGLVWHVAERVLAAKRNIDLLTPPIHGDPEP